MGSLQAGVRGPGRWGSAGWRVAQSTERSRVGVPVRAHPQFASSIPGSECLREAGNQCFSYIGDSLSLKNQQKYTLRWEKVKKNSKVSLSLRKKKKVAWSEMTLQHQPVWAIPSPPDSCGQNCIGQCVRRTSCRHWQRADWR